MRITKRSCRKGHFSAVHELIMAQFHKGPFFGQPKCARSHYAEPTKLNCNGQRGKPSMSTAFFSQAEDGIRGGSVKHFLFLPPAAKAALVTLEKSSCASRRLEVNRTTNPTFSLALQPQASPQGSCTRRQRLSPTMKH